MIARLTVVEVADAARKHPQTVRRACESGELHANQSMRGGHWTVREDCAEAWADRQLCVHQSSNVVQLKRRVS